VLYRKGGLNLTKRWSGTEMKNVAERGGPETLRSIEFTLGIFEEPIRIDVVPFVPIEGDETVRYWTVKENGFEVRKFKHLEAFCLADIHQTAEYFESYIQSNAIEAFMFLRGPMVLDGSGRQSLPSIMERTYMHALAHYWNLPVRLSMPLLEANELIGEEHGQDEQHSTSCNEPREKTARQLVCFMVCNKCVSLLLWITVMCGLLTFYRAYHGECAHLW
jgi:hypothetical protein